jgi:hypothetical protein
MCSDERDGACRNGIYDEAELVKDGIAFRDGLRIAKSKPFEFGSETPYHARIQGQEQMSNDEDP